MVIGLTALIVYLAITALVLRWTYAFVALLATAALLQNLSIMLLLRSGTVAVQNAWPLLLIKELVFAFGFLIVAAVMAFRVFQRGRFRFGAVEWACIGFFLYLLIPFAIADGVGLATRLAGLRGLAILPAFFLLGRWLHMRSIDLLRMQRLLVGFAISIALFGLLEAYVLPANFWLNIGHEEYYLMKRGRPIQGQLYENMRFWIPGVQEPIRRVASITGDPLVSSYPMMFVLVLFASFLISYGRTRLLHIAFGLPIIAATLLTFSRGAAVSLVIALGLLLVARTRPRRFLSMTIVGVFAAVVISLLFGDQLLNITYGRGHLVELQEGLKRGLRYPLGLGLGTASSVATGVSSVMGSRASVVGGGDSYFGSTATQTGIVGVALFTLTMLVICRDLCLRGLRAPEATRTSWLYFGTAAYLASLLVTSTVNESGYGFIASGLAFVFAGVLCSFDDTRPSAEPVMPLASTPASVRHA